MPATEKKGPIPTYVVDPLMDFARNSKFLLNKCHKPDAKEFTKTAQATAVGFMIMGFIGFFVKLVHIPINNILLGAQ